MVRNIGGSLYGQAKIGVSRTDDVVNEFDVGQGSQDVRAAVLAAQHWRPDLTWLLAPFTAVTSGVAGAFIVYATAVAPSTAWPVLSALMCVYVLYAVAVLCVSLWWHTARVLIALTFVSIVMAIAQLVLLVVWVTPAFEFLYDREQWLFWTLFALMTALALAMVGVAMAVASLTNARLYCDAHQNTARQLVEHADDTERHSAKTGARIGAGMAMLRSMVRANEEPTPQQKQEQGLRARRPWSSQAH